MEFATSEEQIEQSSVLCRIVITAKQTGGQSVGTDLMTPVIVLKPLHIPVPRV